MACKLIVYPMRTPHRMLLRTDEHYSSPAYCVIVEGLDNFLYRRVPEQFKKYQDDCRSGVDNSQDIIFSEDEMTQLRSLFMALGASTVKDHKISIIYTYGGGGVQKILYKGCLSNRMTWSTSGHIYDKDDIAVKRIQNTKPQFTLKL